MKHYHITHVTEVIGGNGTGKSYPVDITTTDIERVRFEWITRLNVDADKPIDDVYFTFKTRILKQ